ncbi:MAG: hypothetical protein COC01_03270 [Bacteroidetes bacterium]|nr:hypothetical protein [Bacteroidia bacterium]PCH68683.1 MAG: hypothetical protein COC01_03270 [Bacteroidota bacterium]
MMKISHNCHIKIVVALIISTCIICRISAFAQVSPSQCNFHKIWIYTIKDESRIEGYLLEASDSTINIGMSLKAYDYLERYNKVANEKIPVSDIDRIQIRKRNFGYKIVAITLLTGFGIGAVSGYSLPTGGCGSMNFYCPSQKSNAILLGVGSIYFSAPLAFILNMFEIKYYYIEGNFEKYKLIRSKLQKKNFDP